MVLGSVAGVFGFRGEVRLYLHDPGSGTLATERPVTLVGPDGTRRPARLRARSGAGKRVIGRIEGVGTAEEAHALIGWDVVIDRAELPPPAEGEYYVHDLLGLEVRDEDGRRLGVIAEVVAGDRDVWVVDTGAGEGWIVATPETIRSVDATGIVVARGSMSD